jgi:hypothetical protein
VAFLDDFNKSTKSGNHMSPFGEAGLLFDPLAYIGGDKYKNFMRKTWEGPNKALSPAVKKFHAFEKKVNPYINPLQAEIDKTELGGKVKTTSENKPGDAALAILGAVFGGGALLGGMGGGAGGAGGAGGGGAGAGELGGLGGWGGGTQSGLGIFSNGGAGGMAGVGGGNAGALATAGGVGGGAGMGSATAGGSQMGMQDWMQLGQQGMGAMGGQGGNGGGNQPPQYQPPQPQGIQPIDPSQVQGMKLPPKQSLASRAMGGLGNMRDSLTPIDPRMVEGMDPAHVKQLRNQAMLRMGLGMMSASGQGAGFGESLAAGLGQGVGGFNKDIEGVYERGVEARKEKRAVDRQAIEDGRYTEQLDYRRGRDAESDRDDARDFKATQDYRTKSLASLERRAAAKVPGTDMSEDAIDLAAGRIVNGEKARDVLANFGRGNQGSANITAVQNRVAAMAKQRGMSVEEFAVANQEISAQARMRTELGAREGKIASRVEEAKQFAKIAGTASAKVPRGKFVPVSQLLQYTDKQLSDPDLAAFRAANVSLINAYAAAVGGGVPTVHDKEAAEAMLSTAQSQEAYQAVVNQLITEMDAALQAPRTVMEEMREHDLSKPGGVVNFADLPN